MGVTQSRTLLDAEGMVRDYVATLIGVPEDSFDVAIAPEIGAGADGEILDLREADREAEAARERAAALRRKRRRDGCGPARPSPGSPAGYRRGATSS
ncbi:hypothetical protein [Streptomyces albus]|uniref:hypothetical protein n=1 Tax=Streptomyces albus TaxID=1888 RepID=UPI000692139C|nr:hypothetical protein [Streptomyces albus]